jgi:2-haloacid dehalogenase
MPDQRVRPAVLLFDVNETLLDLSPVEDSVNAFLGEENAAKLWFATLLQYSLVMTVSDRYASFTDIGVAVLQMMARARGMAVHDDEVRRTLNRMQTLSPHPDVRPALEKLRGAGFRLAALTNSSQAGVERQLEHAGLADCFERKLSVESLKKYKPHHGVYDWAAGEMQTRPSDCMLVAAHAWDVAGAGWAGLQAALIQRKGQQCFPLALQPDIEVADLLAFAIGLDA